MAKNTGQGWRSGTPRERSSINPHTSMWARPNSSSGRFMNQRGRPTPGCGDDPEFSWFKRWFALIVTGYAIGFLVVVAVVVWIVLRLTS